MFFYIHNTIISIFDSQCFNIIALAQRMGEREKGRGVGKQGSSENDGRSNVYDCSEFKVISNCCYTNCCRTNCGHFTCIYLNLPELT